MQREALQEQIKTAGRSLFFLSILLGSVCLSWLALDKQRRGLCCTGKAPDVTGLRQVSSVLVVLALGYFFCLGVRSRDQQGGEVNFWASLLVLLAALLRLGELLEENQNEGAPSQARPRGQTLMSGEKSAGPLAKKV